MLVIKEQILGGTLQDRQGEKLSYKFLNDFCDKYKGCRIPMNQHHDILKKTVGHIENLKLIQHPSISDEWQLIGDIYLNEGDVEDAIGGFSISGIEPLIEIENPNTLLYLPYPLYNDKMLIEELSLSNTLNIGKWIKKNNTPELIAIFAPAILFILSPAWEHTYNKIIAPKIDDFIEKQWPKLKKENLGLQHAQLIDYQNSEIEIRFIGEKGKEETCYSPKAIKIAIKKVQAELPNLTAQRENVIRVVMYFDSKIKEYSIHRVEYIDGSVEHMV